MLAAALAKLGELETAGGRLFVLRRRVIALLAFRALQCDDFPHFPNPLSSSQFSVVSKVDSLTTEN
jgi:hypothetical protein